jgi:hypothetical protein
MVKADHLRLAAKLSLARAVRTEEPEVVERLVVRAGEYLDQAAALEAAQTRRSTSDIGAAAVALPGGPNIQRGQRTRASQGTSDFIWHGACAEVRSASSARTMCSVAIRTELLATSGSR